MTEHPCCGRFVWWRDSLPLLVAAFAAVVCMQNMSGLFVPDTINFLREARPQLTAMDNQARLDLMAAELFEANDMFDEAVDAYGGIYR